MYCIEQPQQREGILLSIEYNWDELHFYLVRALHHGPTLQFVRDIFLHVTAAARSTPWAGATQVGGLSHSPHGPASRTPIFWVFSPNASRRTELFDLGSNALI
jgi:hypothetical protein